MNVYNYFFPLNHNSLKLIYACNHEIIYDTPPSNYKTCASVRVKKLGCVKEYLYLVRGKILLGRNYMNNIDIFHVGGHEAYLIANIVFDSDNKYKLIVKDKLFATIEVRDTKPIGVSVVLENMPGSEAVYSNKVENIYVNALKKKEELYDNIWNLGLRNALKEEKISLLIEKKSSRMYSIVHKKPWTGLLSFSIFAVLEASGATRRYFTLD